MRRGNGMAENYEVENHWMVGWSGGLAYLAAQNKELKGCTCVWEGEGRGGGGAGNGAIEGDKL